MILMVISYQHLPLVVRRPVVVAYKQEHHQRPMIVGDVLLKAALTRWVILRPILIMAAAQTQ